jgi:hypothetical protein
MLFPSIAAERSRRGRQRTCAPGPRNAAKRAANAVPVLITPEFGQLARQVESMPEVYPIEALAPDRVSYLGSLGQTFSANYKAMFLTGYEEAEEQHARGESKTA